MRTRPGVRRALDPVTLALLCLSCLSVVRGEESPQESLAPGFKGVVTRTFDGRPFSYEVTEIATKEHCQVVHLRYPSPVTSELVQNNTVPVEYYLPLGTRPGALQRPAVICLHILDGSLELVRMLGSVLASRGVAAVVFPLPYYGERGGPLGPRDILRNPETFVGVLNQTFLEVRRATDFLASRPEINPGQIGIAGISLGGIVAASAAEREPRLYRAVLILSGGDILKVVETAAEAQPLRDFLANLTGPERQRIVEIFREADPLAQAESLKERALAGRVLMINAEHDEVIPRECTERLAQALGISDRVVWLKGLGHYTAIAALPQILEQTASFFAGDLPPEAKPTPPPVQETTPLGLIAGVLRQITQFYLEEPRPGTCHILHLAAVIEGQPTEILFVRGREHQFRLEGQIGGLGRILAGQGEFPWLVSRTGKVFAGEPDSPLEIKSPLTFVQGSVLERLRFTMLALGGLAGTPAALEPLIQVAEQSTQSGRLVVVRPAGNSELQAKLLFPAGSTFPVQIEVSSETGTLQVQVRGFQLHAPSAAGLFAPPSAEAMQTVPRNDLYRMFGALVNYAVELVP